MNIVTESPSEVRFTTEQYPLLLFIDGECAFCNRWAYKVKQADSAHRIRFGAKQGRTYQQLAQLHPELAHVESSVVVQRRADGSGEDFLIRSRCIHAIIAGLPGFRFFDLVLGIVPTFLSDIGYRIFSKLRTPLFGKWHHCRRPLEEDKDLYVD